MSKKKYSSYPHSNFYCYSITILIFKVMVLLMGRTEVNALLISGSAPINTTKAIEIASTSSTSEENTVLTDKHGIKLKEIRKLARLAGHEQPEIITEVDPKLCYKDDCLKAAKEFFISMDFSLEPCLNWRKFSCEWRTLSSKTALDQHTALSLKVESQVKDILLDPDLERGTVRMAQSYYKACKAWYEDFLKIDHIRGYLETLGNWPLLSGKSGGEGEWLNVLSEILRIGPDNVTPFLLRLEASKVDEDDKMLLQIDSGATYLDLDSEDIHDFLQVLRKKPPISLQSEIDAVREMRIAMKTLSSVAFDVPTLEARKGMSLKDIQAKLSTGIPNSKMNILQLIQSTFQGTDQKILPETEVLTDYSSLLEYVKAVSSINQTAILNLLFLQLALILVGDSTNVIEDNGYVHTDNYRRVKLRSPALHCLRETSEVFSYAMSDEYITRQPKPLQQRTMVNELVGHLKTGFTQIISSLPWLDGKGKEMIREKITKTEVLTGYPEWIEDGKLLAVYHGNINLKESNITSKSYLSFRIAVLSWLNGKYWKTKLNDEKLDGWNYDDRGGFVSDTSLEYIPSLNQLRIPAGILQPPLFSSDFPGYMNFGGLGSFIAREMARMLDSNGIFTNSQGEYGSHFDNNTYQKYIEWTSRIQNDWEDDDMTLNSKLVNVLAYHITVKGYQEYLKQLKSEGKEDIKLPGLSTLSPEKLLHVKFTNVLCESSQIKRLRTDMESGQRQTSCSAALYPVTRTNHFSKLFGCELEYANSALDLV